MNNGWIKLHRKLKDHWLYTESREFSKLEAWIDILMEVNHKPHKVPIGNVLLTVNQGESLNSLDTWSKRWKWNKSKVRRFFKMLQDDHMIRIKSETKTTRLTVCNYESYQVERNANETQVKRKRNASDTHLTPNKNDKKEKKEKNIPTWDEFLEHALNKCEESNLELNESDCRLKYEAWKDAGWCKSVKGNPVKIKEWKSTLTHSIKYMSKPKPKRMTQEDIFRLSGLNPDGTPKL